MGRSGLANEEGPPYAKGGPCNAYHEMHKVSRWDSRWQDKTIYRRPGQYSR